MKITIERTLGLDKYTFELEAAKGKDALMMAGVFGDMPTRCSLCGSTVRLASHKAKGYNFVDIKCNKEECGAYAGLGEYKAGGYYWKPFEIYEGKATKDAGEIPVVEDDVPLPEEPPF